MRQTGSRALHGIALRLMADRTTADLSEAQEWLWDGIISELEYRRRRCTEWHLACSCALCVPPFDDY